MALTKEKKNDIVETHKKHAKDTGSCAVQVGLLTEKINVLTGHFQTHKKDFQSRRGLLKAVSQRRRHLDYVKRHDKEEYENLVKKLKLRK